MSGRGWPPLKVVIPDDLMEAIFILLPAKSVLRFRSLSKACNSMTRSTFFSREHLARQQRLHRNLLIYYRTGDSCTNSTVTKLRMVDNDDAVKVSELSTDLDCLNSIKLTAYVYGSCNGLLCLRDNYWSPNVYVCNPLLNEFLRLPSLVGRDERDDGYMCCGLGYDDIRSEFKVVRMVPEWKNENKEIDWTTLEVDVLTIQATGHQGPWRRLKDLRCFLCSHQVASAIGRLHWPCIHLEEPRERLSILAFDPRKEEFQIMICPNYTNTIFSERFSIIEFQGCLSFVQSEFMKHGNLCEVELKVWTMKEYGNSESWIKEQHIKLHVTPIDGGRLPWTWLQWKDDEILIAYGPTLISYNPRNKVASDCSSDIKSHFDFSSLLYITEHVGSLISLKEAGAKVMNSGDEQLPAIS